MTMRENVEPAEQPRSWAAVLRTLGDQVENAHRQLHKILDDLADNCGKDSSPLGPVLAKGIAANQGATEALFTDANVVTRAAAQVLHDALSESDTTSRAGDGLPHPATSLRQERGPGT